jgi:hypothetical protein
MKRLFRRILWALIRWTDPPGQRLPKRLPGQTQVRYADPPRTIPLPPGVPKVKTIRMDAPAAASVEIPKKKEALYPGMKPPQVRQS